MKKTIQCFLVVLIGLYAQSGFAQTIDTSRNETLFDKKFYWGITFNNSWSKVTGNVEPYFTKPSLGGGFKFDYYFTHNVGISWGLNFQQRGSGIKTPDNVATTGDGDSTNRLRLRFNSLDLPIALVFRGKSGAFKNPDIKFTGGLGITPQYNFRTTRFFASVEDGFHNFDDNSDHYYRFGLSVDANFGLAINASNSAIFQPEIIVGYGLNNIHRGSGLFPEGTTGHNFLLGIRLSFMFSNYKY
jgi:hypothetical protein